MLVSFALGGATVRRQSRTEQVMRDESRFDEREVRDFEHAYAWAYWILYLVVAISMILVIVLDLLSSSALEQIVATPVAWVGLLFAASLLPSAVRIWTWQDLEDELD